MQLQIVDSLEGCEALTHAGVFHADEVMASAILSHCGIQRLARSFKVPAAASEHIVVFDIGGGAYDHHMPGGNGSRVNGTPYSSCGLIWRDFGLRTCAAILGTHQTEQLKSIWSSVDETLIQPIDASDNGVGERNDSGITAILSDFNPAWNSGANADEAFLNAVELADTVLVNRVRSAGATALSRHLVDAALSSAMGPILVLDRYIPWKDALDADPRGNNILFVIYPAVRGGYNCQCVPPHGMPFSQKCPLPQEWRGLLQEDLRTCTGISDAIFAIPVVFSAVQRRRKAPYRLQNLPS